jgi:hypothetical protein
MTRKILPKTLRFRVTQKDLDQNLADPREPRAARCPIACAAQRLTELTGYHIVVVNRIYVSTNRNRMGKGYVLPKAVLRRINLLDDAEIRGRRTRMKPFTVVAERQIPEP